MFIFAVFQILFESLPISSSGHLALFSRKISEGLEYFIHGPSVLVILFFFRKELGFFLRNFTNQIGTVGNFIFSLLFADFVTVFIYFGLKFFYFTFFPLWLGFLFTSLFIFSTYLIPILKKHNNETDLFSLSLLKAGMIGFAQGLALLPGISRLGVLYSTGVWFGLKPRASFAFSLAVAVPIFAAGSFKGFIQIYSSQEIFELVSFTKIFTTFLALVGAYYLLVWVSHLAQKGKLWWFGVYLILPALISFFFAIS